MRLARSPLDSDVWILALALSILVHFLGALSLWVLRPFAPAAARPPDPIAVILQSQPAADPTMFTELPPDAADEAPDRPDFLSNVDSRARDDVSGGAESLPRMTGRSEAPQVQLTKGDPQPSPPTTDAPPSDPMSAETGAAPSPAAAPVSEEIPLRALGTLDFRQEEMANPDGNAALAGDIRLSTTAWKYAPWLQAFRRAVTARWHPPPAYFMGLIDGWVLAELEIAPDGRLLDLRVLDERIDHDSLRQAVLYALKAPAPYRHLPDDFPDPTLRLQIRFVYPEAVRR